MLLRPLIHKAQIGSFILDAGNQEISRINIRVINMNYHTLADVFSSKTGFQRVYWTGSALKTGSMYPPETPISAIFYPWKNRKFQIFPKWKGRMLARANGACPNSLG